GGVPGPPAAPPRGGGGPGRPPAVLSPLPVQVPPRLDLRLGVPDPDLFPDDEWRSHVRRALRDPRAAQYGDPAGEPMLRAAIAAWIHRSRGVAAAPERTVVTAGAQQAFDLILGGLLRDVVAVEDPGYPPFHKLARMRGARILPVPVDAEGLVVDALPARARLVYVTPSHQFPLGSILSLPRRRRLLAWARAAGAHIIEDDYDSEFRFSDRPLEPLARLDDAARVLYVGSFSKTLSPSLRLGFLVAPDEIVASLAGMRQIVDWCSPAFVQRALAGLLADGTMDRHLRRAGRAYRARHGILVEWLSGPGRRLGRLVPGDAGPHGAVELARGVDEARLVARARARGVAVEGLGPYSIDARRPGVAMGYGAATPERLAEALPILLDLLRSPVRGS